MAEPAASAAPARDQALVPTANPRLVLAAVLTISICQFLDQMISNVNIITWPQPATADWPAVGWICLFDAVDTLHHWTTCPSLVVASGVTPFISPGALSILVNL